MEQTENSAKVTPKDFFLWAAAMITLYWSIGALIALLFSYIDYAYPDSLSYIDPYSSGMRFSIASLIVLSPAFLGLMRVIRNDIQKNAEKFNLWVRRWALYLTLFIAGLTILGDLIALVNVFLNGDITTRFTLKVAVILLVAAGFFMHFLADLKGYWQKYPMRASYVNYGAGVVVLLVIVSGFFIIGSPNDARLYRFDDQRANDLSQLENNITYFWQAKQKLPASLAELSDPTRGVTVPMDPETGARYVYSVTGAQSFKLCAVFVKESRSHGESSFAPVRFPDESWQHGVGETCFTRTIDPSFYPPLAKPAF